MDCEKADSLMLDELYGELDEVSSAALSKHLGGCAKCAPVFQRLLSTRRLVRLPDVATPPDFAERIAAHALEQGQANRLAPVVPLAHTETRTSRVVSLLGRWAMRPQTAMAAVFLLMIGSSALLLKGRARRDSASVTITEKGSPVEGRPASAAKELDFTSDPAAHGIGGARGVAAASPPPAPAQIAPQTVTPAAQPQSAPADLALVPGKAPKPAEEESQNQREQRGPMAGNGGPVAGATLADDGLGRQGAGGFAGNVDRDGDRLRSGEGAKDKKKSDSAESAFDAALSAYKSRSYDDATRRFDVLARAGDTQAALYAARSVRDGHGCSASLTRFDQLSSSAFGQPAGHDAALEGGVCYRNLGSLDAASSRFTRLLLVPSHAGRAQAELDQVHRIAQRRADEAKERAEAKAEATGAAGPGGHAAARSAPAPAAPPAKPAASASASKGADQR